MIFLRANILLFLIDIISGQTITHVLNIRDNGKICTQWINYQSDTVLYHKNRECIGDPSFEYQNVKIRLCCQGMPLTTPAINFPRECGKQQHTPLGQRIIGGIDVQAHSWPWQVLFRTSNNLCGGTLIDERHILTAAHCTKTSSVASDYKIIVGLHDESKPYYMEQEIIAEQLYVHEQYDAVTTTNDIAVIRLSKPIQISDKVNVICLPGPEATTVNETVWIAGWGKTSLNGQTGSVLKQRSLKIMDSCVRYWSPSYYQSAKQICAGTYDGLIGDACNGDSGGPLMYQQNGQWFINGITSFASQCGTTHVPSVYVRVSYYLPWIRAKMALAILTESQIG